MHTGQTTSDSLLLSSPLEELAEVEGSNSGCDNLPHSFSLFPLVPLPVVLPATYTATSSLLPLERPFEELVEVEGSGSGCGTFSLSFPLTLFSLVPLPVVLPPLRSLPLTLELRLLSSLEASLEELANSGSSQEFPLPLPPPVPLPIIIDVRDVINNDVMPWYGGHFGALTCSTVQLNRPFVELSSQV